MTVKELLDILLSGAINEKWTMDTPISAFDGEGRTYKIIHVTRQADTIHISASIWGLETTVEDNGYDVS